MVSKDVSARATYPNIVGILVSTFWALHLHSPFDLLTQFSHASARFPLSSPLVLIVIDRGVFFNAFVRDPVMSSPPGFRMTRRRIGIGLGIRC